MAYSFARLTTVVALFASAETSVFAAGTQEQRDACTPDAFKLCASAIPDEARVESCLRSAGSRLSPACHAVFYPEPGASTTQVTRGPVTSRDHVQPSATDRVETPSMPRAIDDND